ncbi:hypothetical protein N7462_009502 [Penicillium macrosclerotiorum]|uniref:uncharacterized protein n=1 Tax=Penicillium macrosclerotiorum TaxID=303699 RepID=UPI002548F212|nr:uncharacterized protein N7462_009502 [Penicillium macrosclerotiorum]KAJ5674063.1 hypothetical protein N7462_009502 [Penicillium macrosclerotiorum]
MLAPHTTPQLERFVLFYHHHDRGKGGKGVLPIPPIVLGPWSMPDPGRASTDLGSECRPASLVFRFLRLLSQPPELYDVKASDLPRGDAC